MVLVGAGGSPRRHHWLVGRPQTTSPLHKISTTGRSSEMGSEAAGEDCTDKPIRLEKDKDSE